MREKRIGRRGRGAKAADGGGAFVKSFGVFALGKQIDCHGIPVLKGGHAHQFEEAAKGDGDLPVERVGFWQHPGQIG